MSVTHSPILLEVDHVSFAYDGVPALEHVTTHVHQGDYLGIIGPNGGGKTTLLKIMLGLLKPDSGTVSLFGNAHPGQHERQDIAYVPQHPSEVALEFPVSVEEMVESGRTVGLSPFGHLRGDDHAAIKQALGVTGLTDIRRSIVGTLSGGQRQRVYLARALAAKPRLLILDEPSVGVDAAAQASFYQLLRTLNHEHQLTIILVSHDLEIVSQEVHTVLCLNRKLVAHGSPEDTLHSAAVQHAYASSSLTHQH